MFCKSCIEELLRYKNSCTNNCRIPQDSVIKPASRIIWKIIRKHEIRCVFCDDKFKVENIDEHQQQCKRVKCLNPLCRKLLDKKKYRVIGTFGYACSEICKFVAMYQVELNKSKSTTPLAASYEVIKMIKLKSDAQGKSDMLFEPMKDVPMTEPCRKTENSLSLFYGMNEFVWDTSTSNTLVKFSAENRIALLNDSQFTYRNIFGSVGFIGGSQYWEIIIDSKTQNELKIGVSKTNNKNMECAFSDAITGYAYYGLGELRHGENSTSIKYGKKFRKSGIIGVYLNMDHGSLSFSLNGECLGPAFIDKALEKGPIYPAVALLRVSGVILVTGKPVPPYFKH